MQSTCFSTSSCFSFLKEISANSPIKFLLLVHHHLSEVSHKNYHFYIGVGPFHATQSWGNFGGQYRKMQTSQLGTLFGICICIIKMIQSDVKQIKMIQFQENVICNKFFKCMKWYQLTQFLPFSSFLICRRSSNSADYLHELIMIYFGNDRKED